MSSRAVSDAGYRAHWTSPDDGERAIKIYSRVETQLLVTFSSGEETVQRFVTLQRMNGLGGYATIGDFPTFASGEAEIKVTLEPLPTLNPLPQSPFWGFISVTNNETQAITTITPQR